MGHRHHHHVANLLAPLASTQWVPLVGNLSAPHVSTLWVPLVSTLWVPLFGTPWVPLVGTKWVPLVSTLWVPLVSTARVPSVRLPRVLMWSHTSDCHVALCGPHNSIHVTHVGPTLSASTSASWDPHVRPRQLCRPILTSDNDKLCYIP